MQRIFAVQKEMHFMILRNARPASEAASARQIEKWRGSLPQSHQLFSMPGA